MSSLSVDSLSFSTFELDDKTSLAHAIALFSPFIQDLSLSSEGVRNLIHDIQNKYKQNPFHSFSHALTVAQMMYLFITKTKLSTMLNTKVCN